MSFRRRRTLSVTETQPTTTAPAPMHLGLRLNGVRTSARHPLGWRADVSVNPTAESATSLKLSTVIRGFAAFALSVLVAGCAGQPSQSHAYQVGYTDGQSGAAANMALGGWCRTGSFARRGEIGQNRHRQNGR